MENSRKYVLVPEERLQNFGEEHFSQLDKELHAILKRKGLSDEEKSTLYLQVLQKFVKFPGLQVLHPETSIDRPHDPIPTIKEEKAVDGSFGMDAGKPTWDIEKDLILKTQNKKKVALNLLKFIREQSHGLSWTPEKNIIVKGQVLKRTNIVNLINYVIRSVKKKPKGSTEFVNVLRELNVPSNLIQNVYLNSTTKNVKSIFAKPPVKKPVWQNL